jgi:hypothetical protein
MVSWVFVSIEVLVMVHAANHMLDVPNGIPLCDVMNNQLFNGAAI